MDELLPRAWLTPLRLTGGGRLPSHLLPGPMEGVTTGSWVAAMSRQRLVDAWITPFIRVSNAVPRRCRLESRLAEFVATGLPLVVQLMGTHAELIAETAARCATLGAVAVDLNCACPSKMVVASRCGGALLRQPAWIAETLLALRRACPKIGIGVKLRSGFADSEELREILPAVQAGAPDFVVLHYRTVAEMYAPVGGRSRRLALARQLVPDLVLLASGDLDSPAAALSTWRETGVDGLTVARGLLRNPWLLGDLAAACRGEPPAARPLAATLLFIAELAATAAASSGGKGGFILEIARHALADQPQAFKALAARRSCAELAVEARQLAGQVELWQAGL